MSPAGMGDGYKAVIVRICLRAGCISLKLKITPVRVHPDRGDNLFGLLESPFIRTALWISGVSVVEVEVFVRISDQGEVAFEFGAGNDHRGSAIVGVETQTVARLQMTV